MNIAPGEALFIGMWYVTILTIAVTLTVLTIHVVRIANHLAAIRQWLSHLVIARAATGVENHEPPRRDT